MNGRKGFTLIELIAVIIIIGIIAVLIVPSISHYIVGTKDTAYKSHERAMSEAAQSYTIECINSNGKDCEIPGPNEEKSIYLYELINNDLIDKLGDPAKTGSFCNANTSYVKIYNTSHDDYEYTACLYCSAYATENPSCVTYSGDSDNPECVTVETHSEWTSESRQVRVGCRDASSGCLREEFKRTFSSTTDRGIITITDKSGNSTDCEVEVKVDKTAPTCEIVASGTPVNGWYPLGTKFTLVNYTDGESGVLTYGTGTSVHANFNKITEQTPPRGITRIFGYVQDAAGNIGVCSTNAKIKTEFVIHYNPNGGTGTMPDKKCMIDDDCFLDPNTFTRTGYTFNGWNTREDGTGHTYVDRANVKNIVFSGDVTLFAQWKPIPYTITYHLNGGTVNGTNPTTYTIESNDITLINPTKPGYTFDGWTGTGLSSKTLTVTIPKGSIGNREYTANWTAKTIVVTFDCNGGTGGGTQPFTYDVTGQKFNKTCLKTGYNLKGWNKKSDGSGTHYTVTNGVANSWIDSNYPAITLYAEWEANTYKIRFNKNASDATGSMADKPCTYDVDCQLPANGFNRPGYTFKNWSFGTINYNNGAVVKNLTTENGATVTLFANWNPRLINISYNLNGGSPGAHSPTSTYYDSDVLISHPTKKIHVTYVNTIGATVSGGETEDDYYFAGWTSSNVGTNALYGKESATNAWDGEEPTPIYWGDDEETAEETGYTYFKYLKESGTVTLNADWSTTAITLPSVTLDTQTCGWAIDTEGNGFLPSGTTYAPDSSTPTEATLYAYCSTTCVYPSTYFIKNGERTGLVTNVDFDSDYAKPGGGTTGSFREQTVEIVTSGYYKLEVWGAQGGNHPNRYTNKKKTNQERGGYGGYSTGAIYLTAGTKLYINVGGLGANVSGKGTAAGGYNGGGNAVKSGTDGWVSCGSSGIKQGSGGGATHIATRSGLLSSFASSYPNGGTDTNGPVLIVAGGGGGHVNTCDASGGSYTGGDGGGYKGEVGADGSASGALGGAQIAVSTSGYHKSNGSFGQGGATREKYGGGGGGGFFGGGGSWTTQTNRPGSGAGGSGYINSASLISYTEDLSLTTGTACNFTKHMVTDGGASSTSPETYTIKNGCHSGTATSDCSKVFGGYARVTFLGGGVNNLTINPNGGSLSINGSSAVTVSVSLTKKGGEGVTIDVSRADYQFNGWTHSGTCGQFEDSKHTVYTFPYEKDGSCTLTAKWKIDTYPITYHLNGGTVSGTNPTTYTKETNDITLINPTLDGHYFDGWTGTGLSSATTTVKIPKGSKGSREYTANWTPKKIVVTFNCNGGTGGGTQQFTYGVSGQKFNKTCSSRDGYTLTGWNKKNDGSGAHYNVESGVSNKWIDDNSPEITLYAEWSAETYTITYHLNGGTVSGTNPTTYTIKSNNITLINPTKDDYSFEGWTGTGLSSKTLTVTIPKGSIGNREYTANWVVNKIKCVPGKYLPSKANTCSTCRPGNYCPGGEFYIRDYIQGSEECPSSYTSDSGSDEVTDCYRYEIASSKCTKSETPTGEYWIFWYAQGDHTGCTGGWNCSDCPSCDLDHTPRIGKNSDGTPTLATVSEKCLNGEMPGADPWWSNYKPTPSAPFWCRHSNCVNPYNGGASSTWHTYSCKKIDGGCPSDYTKIDNVSHFNEDDNNYYPQCMERAITTITYRYVSNGNTHNTTCPSSDLTKECNATNVGYIKYVCTKNSHPGT